MQPQFYKQTARVEDQHWWFLSRRALVARHIQKMALPSDASILDAGCGTGATTRFLERYGRVTGIDKSPIALAFAREKTEHAHLIEADVNELDCLLPPESFDLVTFFGVLNHQWIPDDVKMLQRVKRVLKPGGHVLLTESAFRILTRRHDVVDLAKTRYRMADFRSYFAQVGLEFRWGRYFNAAAFPICLLEAAWYRLFGRSDNGNGDLAELTLPPRAVNSMLRFYMDVERRLSSWIPLPFGVTLLVVGRKKVVQPGRE